MPQYMLILHDDLAALRGGAGAGGIGVYPTGVLDLLD